MSTAVPKLSSRFVGYLFRYMSIFEIDRFWLLGVSNKSILAKIGWPDDGRPNYEEDEEVQVIEWEVQNFGNIEDALSLSEFIKDSKLVDNDKIIVSQEELFKLAGWDKKQFDEALETLLKIRVDMIDDGKKTDYFFLHF